MAAGSFRFNRTVQISLATTLTATIPCRNPDTIWPWPSRPQTLIGCTLGGSTRGDRTTVARNGASPPIGLKPANPATPMAIFTHWNITATIYLQAPTEDY